MTRFIRTLATSREQKPVRTTRSFFLLIMILLACGTVFAVRLFDLMIARGQTFRTIADNNRFYQRVLLPHRGIVYDREGEKLIVNTAVLTMNESSKLYKDRIGSTVLDPVSAVTVSVSSPSAFRFDDKRVYPVGPSLSHLLGFVGFVRPSAFERVASLDLRVGKSGVEKAYDLTLQGIAGKQIYEINAVGNITRLISEIPSVSGKNLKLTIDKKLSEFAYAQLHGKTGAVVVTDVKNSTLLTLTSSPSYEIASYSAALTDPAKPLINRALSAYPPGSVFKMITSLAALEQDAIQTDTKILDEGKVEIGGTTFRNWYYRQYGKSEGEIDVVQAISRSNDVFFYKVAQMVGPEDISRMALSFGFGKKTGVKLPEDAMGVVPTPAWKERQVGEKWYTGDTLNYGIGQGYITTTPLQVNQMTATLGRNGTWCVPRLTLQELKDCKETGVNREYLDAVIQGMVNACSSGGTAFPFFPINEGLLNEKKIACKTGTAEFGGVDADGKRRTHAWLTLFYPRIDPTVAITVFLESSATTPFLEGSVDAAPIAKAVWEEWKKKYDSIDTRLQSEIQ